mmetsp:Transcript_17111/g.48897  ORF Transcript_17111/g.48897 Transcript_17111/m.48897 type:complete len:591 (+) Transcript_17111:401-2173(+)
MRRAPRRACLRARQPAGPRGTGRAPDLGPRGPRPSWCRRRGARGHRPRRENRSEDARRPRSRPSRRRLSARAAAWRRVALCCPRRRQAGRQAGRQHGHRGRQAAARGRGGGARALQLRDLHRVGQEAQDLVCVAHLAPRRGPHQPHPRRVGQPRPDQARARRLHRPGQRAPQRHRRPRRLVLHLPRARHRLQRARSGLQAQLHQHAARREDRPLRPVGQPRQDRDNRPLWRRGPHHLRQGHRGGRRHPPHHRHHEGAHRLPRDQGRPPRGPPQAGRQDPHAGRPGQRHQGRHRALLVPPWRRQALWRHRGPPAQPPLPGDQRHVPRAAHPHRPAHVPAPHRRPHHLHLRRCGKHFGPKQEARRPRARRVQRQRRIRLGHLHLPPVPALRHRGGHRDRPAGRRRRHRLLSQGGPRAGRGHQVPRVQRAQAPGGRRQGQRVLQLHPEGRRRHGQPLPGADARLPALARHHQDRQVRLHEQHEVRRDHRERHRDHRAHSDSGSPCAQGCTGRDHGQGLRGLRRRQRLQGLQGRPRGYHGPQRQRLWRRRREAGQLSRHFSLRGVLSPPAPPRPRVTKLLPRVTSRVPPINACR